MLERGVTYRQAALAVGVTKGAFVHYKSGIAFLNYLFLFASQII